jgi:hypothetical protein
VDSFHFYHIGFSLVGHKLIIQSNLIFHVFSVETGDGGVIKFDISGAALFLLAFGSLSDMSRSEY